MLEVLNSDIVVNSSETPHKCTVIMLSVNPSQRRRGEVLASSAEAHCYTKDELNPDQLCLSTSVTSQLHESVSWIP